MNYMLLIAETQADCPVAGWGAVEVRPVWQEATEPEANPEPSKQASEQHEYHISSSN